MADLWKHGAGELAEMIRKGEASSVEVVESHLSRIDAVNGSLNALVKVLGEQALSRASEIDAARAKGEKLGPLAGVPFTVKENIDFAGLPTTNGVPGLAEAVAPFDAPVVERMRGAGGVPIGRTNLPDMGLRVHTDSALYGVTRNPWKPGRTAGGSSGGEAASLAVGMTPIGLGNDLGGSLRNPASCCGIASIKPTMGRVPHANLIPMEDEGVVFQHMVVEGPMARRVADVRLGLSILAGAHLRDPRSVPMPIEPPTPPTKRVALLPNPPAGQTDPRVADVTRAAGHALEKAGYSVEEIEPPRYEEVIAIWTGLVLADVRVALPLLSPLLSDEANKFLSFSLEATEPATMDTYAQTWMQRHSLQKAWGQFFSEWDAVVSPTWTQLPFEHGYDVSSAEAGEYVLELMRPVMPANALGLPSAAVPAGVVDGLPVGVLVTGAMWHDLTCLDIAEKIEAAELVPKTPIDPVT
ncbi:MAG: indole acetimide hydrolase [Deltaproteobacteria bacterium]|nr:indole acetimide hydrolase [Deltaproteobacteria bacterium]MBW1817496.1 indole acetimide hydrolase [Deltaproteobacteria bacterium]